MNGSTRCSSSEISGQGVYNSQTFRRQFLSRMTASSYLSVSPSRSKRNEKKRNGTSTNEETKNQHDEEKEMKKQKEHRHLRMSPAA
jgi:hypothetical protein